VSINESGNKNQKLNTTAEYDHGNSLTISANFTIYSPKIHFNIIPHFLINLPTDHLITLRCFITKFAIRKKEKAEVWLHVFLTSALD
jgi:hypothetical protein